MDGDATQTPWLWPLVVAGPVLVAGYNLELFGGRLHTDLGFAAVVGRLPGAHRATSRRIRRWAAAGARAALSVAVGGDPAVAGPASAQHPGPAAAPALPRTWVADDKARALAPLEGALRALAWAHPLLALGLLAARVL